MRPGDAQHRRVARQGTLADVQEAGGLCPRALLREAPY